MGTNRDSRDDRPQSRHEDDSDARDKDEQRLLETILRDTMSGSNGEALKLVFTVARASDYKDTSNIGAVEEFVRAIIKNRFGARRFSNSFIHRVACSLIDVPEAAVKLERLWQEARISG